MQQIRQLQKAAETHSTEVSTLHDTLQRVMAELLTLTRAAESAAAGARFGADQQQTTARMQTLLDRMGLLRQV